MTIPESTVAIVRAVLQHYAAITVDDMGIRASHALTALDSTPPPAMGGLPEGCPNALMFGDWKYDPEHCGFHGEYRKSCEPFGCVPVEIHSQGARSRMEEMIEGLRLAIAWAESASTRIQDRENINWRTLNKARDIYSRAILRDGGKG